jgi:hypothetical protein
MRTEPGGLSRFYRMIAATNVRNDTVERVSEETRGSSLVRSVRAFTSDEGWVESIARRLNLESTLHPGGRERIQPLPKDTLKEACLNTVRHENHPHHHLFPHDENGRLHTIISLQDNRGIDRVHRRSNLAWAFLENSPGPSSKLCKVRDSHQGGE